MTTNDAVDRLSELTVGDVMNKRVVTVGADQSMSEVAQTFLNHNISAAPVVDGSERIVGVLSATDFLRRDGHRPSNGAGGGSDTVRRHMTEAVQTTSAETSLLRAAMIMSVGHIHRLPVVDEQDRVVGVVSTMDITAAMVNVVDELHATLLKQVGGRSL